MEPGTSLGPYLIGSELGSGGMGKVYAATVEGRVPGLDVGAPVALKVVHPHLLETPGFFKRFLREGEIGKTVRHPNVVRTYDCDATGGQHFLAMEYVEGQTLRELLDESAAHVDGQTRQAMLTNLRVPRQIMRSWRAQFGGRDEAVSVGTG